MSEIPLRLIAFAAVLGAHAILLIVVVTVRLKSTSTEQDEVAAILFMLPLNETERPSPQQKVLHAPPSAPHARPEDTHIEARQAPAAQQESSSAPVAIDWAREAERAAAREIDAGEDAARKAAAFSAPKGALGGLHAAAPPKPQFGWSHARIHRIESLPEGGFILNLSDRCAIVVSIMLMPGCKLGKSIVRGDLLQHMDDPPLLGEWASELP